MNLHKSYFILIINLIKHVHGDTPTERESHTEPAEERVDGW